MKGAAALVAELLLDVALEFSYPEFAVTLPRSLSFGGVSTRHVNRPFGGSPPLSNHERQSTAKQLIVECDELHPLQSPSPGQASRWS